MHEQPRTSAPETVPVGLLDFLGFFGILNGLRALSFWGADVSVETVSGTFCICGIDAALLRSREGPGLFLYR